MSRDSIRCKYCNCAHTKVEKTVQRTVKWRGQEYVRVKRYRVCQNQKCGLSFTSIEDYEDEEKPDNPVVRREEPPKPPEPTPPKEVQRPRNPFL